MSITTETETLNLIKFATCALPAIILSDQHWASTSVTSNDQFKMLFYFNTEGQRVALDNIEDINERRMALLFVAYACAPKGFIIP